MVIELDLHLSGLVFPRPGEYLVQVTGAGEFLMERRLVVISAPPLPEEGSEDADSSG